MRINIIMAAIAAVATVSPAFAEDGGYVGAGITHENIAFGSDLEGLGFNGIGGTVFTGYKMEIGGSTYAALEANFDLSTAKVGDDE